MDIQESIKNIPASPGVYLFYDEKGRTIYIGKALNLKKRVLSYFQSKIPNPRIELMISNAKRIDYIPTSSDEEALIYEASLIKERKPKYNIALRDDKSYPYLKLTVREDYPRLIITREIKKDGSLYYGPFTNVKLLRRAVSMMKRIFPLRVCDSIPKKECLYFHFSQCLAPCINRNINKLYRDAVIDIKLFLRGKKTILIKRLSKRMKRYAKKMQYEEALKIRDQIDALSAITGTRKSISATSSDLKELKDLLNLKQIPARIEAFDVSNISGQGAVGSMVTFFNGMPFKNDYRRFKIKTVKETDDYAMIREIVKRRYARLLSEKKKMPDLILIDGGKGHLNTALDELKKIGLKIPVASIAKRPERIFFEGKLEYVNMPYDSKAFRLIQRVRDEAHRFAISYQKIVRKKELFK